VAVGAVLVEEVAARWQIFRDGDNHGPRLASRRGLGADRAPRRKAVFLGKPRDLGLEQRELALDGRLEIVLPLADSNRCLPGQARTAHRDDLVLPAEARLVVVAGGRSPDEGRGNFSTGESLQRFFGKPERRQLLSFARGEQDLRRRAELDRDLLALEIVERSRRERPRRDERVTHGEERARERHALRHELLVVWQAEVRVALIGEQRVSDGALA